MSVLQSIYSTLNSAGFTAGLGQFPMTPGDCAKIIFPTEKDKAGQDKCAKFLGDDDAKTGTFKVVVRGNDYHTIITQIVQVETAMKSAGFMQIGMYEDVESKTGETFMQLAVNFKFIKTN